MATTWEQLAEQAMALPSESRARLADRLVESLDVDELGPIDQLWPPKQNADETRFAQALSNRSTAKTLYVKYVIPCAEC